MNSKSIDMQGGSGLPIASGASVATDALVAPGDSAAPGGAVASEANGGETFDVAVIGAGRRV